MRKLLLLLLVSIFIISFAKADSVGLQIRYIVPDEEVTFDNCRNFLKYTDIAFSESITASSDYGIESYWLNDTLYFNVSNEGLIVNVTLLSSAIKHSLNLSANNSIGKQASCIFYIDIREVEALTTTLCSYRKFGFYNLKYMGLKSELCV